MALKVTNISDLKNSELKIKEAKNSYLEALNGITDAVKSTELFWQGEDAYKFRREIYSLIKTDFNDVKEELEFEELFLNRVRTTLENAQEEVKKRLNS